MSEYIEVNGVKYRQVVHKKPPMPKILLPLMFMAGFSSRRKETHDVNIVEEYGLIQQKKSRLSKSQRDWVVAQFEYNFVKIL